jgi:3-phosphoshikimate 1-carboxyvinyltransferase
MPTDQLVVEGGRPLRGRLRLPGCKGISHRALLFAALAEGTSRITNLADGDDVSRTLLALTRLGVGIGSDAAGVAIVSAGREAWHAPDRNVDCGNSGTTMRMLCGLLAPTSFTAVLTGDESLSRRPMARVVEPLRRMGAHIDGPDGGAHAPLRITGAALHGERHELPVASGQVKTALVLAGLGANGTTEVVEPAPSRDHTERMLGALYAPIERVDDRTVRISAGVPHSFALDVPGDASSAAFFVVAATIVPGSDIVLEDVALNPGRVEYLDRLREMGADIDTEVTEERLGEPVGRIAVRSAPLRGIEISGTESIVDELPVLAVAGAFASGVTTIRDAAELAVKESDRIATIAELLGALGVDIERRPDGLVVRGGRPRGATTESHGDHRVALTAAVAGLAAEGRTTVRGWPAVAISYPGFERDLASLVERP